jgi:hypothetical protein
MLDLNAVEGLIKASHEKAFGLAEDAPNSAQPAALMQYIQAS